MAEARDKFLADRAALMARAKERAAAANNPINTAAADGAADEATTSTAENILPSEEDKGQQAHRHPLEEDTMKENESSAVVQKPNHLHALRNGPTMELHTAESDDFLRSIVGQPWGVLGSGLTADNKLHHDGPDPMEMPSVCK
jgi:hypothetical protein